MTEQTSTGDSTISKDIENAKEEVKKVETTITSDEGKIIAFYHKIKSFIVSHKFIVGFAIGVLTSVIVALIF